MAIAGRGFGQPAISIPYPFIPGGLFPLVAPASRHRPIRSRLASWLTAAVFVYFAAAAIVSASDKSAAWDEVLHLGAGISYWKTGDFRMNPEHPPLVKALAGGIALLAAPVAWRVTRPDNHGVLSYWADGDQVLFGNHLLYHQNDADRILFWARLAPIAFGLLGGWVAWWWGRRIGGPWGGFSAAAFLLLYPEYMGHARWVTFDAPTAAVCGLMSVALWNWWRRPNARRAALFLLAAVFAALVKLTAGVFLAALGIGALVMALARAWSRRAPASSSSASPSLRRPFLRRRGVLPLVCLYVAAFGAVYVAFWAASGFRFSLTAPDQPALERPSAFLPYCLDARAAAGEDGDESRIVRLTRPFYEARLLPETLLCVLNHAGSFSGRLSFLRGKTSRDGFPDYFFWTILYKTPLMYLVLGAIAARLGLARLFHLPAGPFARLGAARFRASMAFFVLPFALLFLLTALSRINLGHRYILFIYIPWCVGMGALTGRWIERRDRRWPRRLGVGLLVWAFAINLAAFPDYATWFNALGGGPFRRVELLRDSNIGWGQDLKAAGKFVRDHDLGEVNLAYFGPGDPPYYGIARYRPILPSYPFTIALKPAVTVDLRLYSLVSLNNLPDVRLLYPGVFDGKPEAILSSILVYPPAAPPGAPPESSLLSPKAQDFSSPR